MTQTPDNPATVLARIPEGPTFLLTSTDPFAPHLVMIWACLRNGDLEGALNEFNSLVQDHATPYFEDPDEASAREAVGIAEAMEQAPSVELF